MQRRLADAFLESAHNHPSSAAVSYEAERLTYADLLAWASAVSAAIQSRVRAGSVVALTLPRGIEQVVATVATTLAGCAYLPLDPSYPAERLEFCLGDSGASLVVGDPGGLAGPHCPPVVSVRDCRPAADAASGAGETAPARDGGEADAAYIIYTSGSTGTPKGVVVEHRQVLAMLEAAGSEVSAGADDVWTMFHSPSFDFSVWEMWGALLRGGRLVVVPERTARSPEAMVRLVERERVSVLSQTPAAFRPFAAVAVGQQSPLASLRVVVFGGERLDPAMLAPWAEQRGLAAPELVNMYGITETTVHATVRRLTEADVRRPGRSPIGRPLGHLSIDLLDADGAPVAAGSAGEMVLSGPGVARGYLNRPDLQAERFPTRPIGPGGASVRCYRSGDLARLDDGELVFVGRNDAQLKVRGYRIEPHEVEVALERGAGVEAACVVAANAGPGDDRLVAFVVAEPAGAAEPAGGAEAPVRPAAREAEIKADAARRLPAHLCPSHVYAVDALPLTANGKIDSAGLRERASAHLRRLTTARTESELDADGVGVGDQVVALGRRVVGVDGLDIDGDLFDQGATSLAVVRFLAEINATLGVEVTPDHLVSVSSLRDIAGLVERLRAEAGAGPAAVAVGV